MSEPEKQKLTTSSFTALESANPTVRIRPLLEGRTDVELFAAVRATSVEDSVASAWELCRRQGVIRPLDRERAVDVDAKVLAWFLGVVDARVLTAVPAWWKNGLKSAVYFEEAQGSPRRSFMFPYTDALFGEVFAPIGGAGEEYFVTVNRDIEFDKANKLVRLSHFGKTAALPASIWEAYVGGTRKRAIEFWIKDNYVILLAVPDTVPQRRFWLAAFSLEGKLLWEQSIWAGVAEGPRAAQSVIRGTSKPIAQIVVEDDSVYVFGSHAGAFYVEEFSALTGTSVLRFSTSY